MGVLAGLLIAINHPVVFLSLLALFVLLLFWLLPRVWRGLRRVFRFVTRLFGCGRDDPADQRPGESRD